MTVKKLALLLAVLLMCGTLFACTDSKTGDDQTNASATDKSTETKKEEETTKKEDVTSKEPSTEVQPPIVDTPIADLLPSSRFTLDGKLDEWNDLFKIDLQGLDATAHKHVSFYAASTEDGLYLACDAYHDEYKFGVSDWWLNSNFEFFIPAATGQHSQYFVYADGIDAKCKTSENVTDAIMKTEALTEQPTKYHTITEVFLAYDKVPTALDENTVQVGVAWKTVDELIIGGSAHKNPDGSDDWWVPQNTWPTNYDLLITPKGLCFPADFF